MTIGARGGRPGSRRARRTALLVGPVLGGLLAWVLVRAGSRADPSRRTRVGRAPVPGPVTGALTGAGGGRATRRPGSAVHRFHRFYGAHPLHLLVLVASLTLTAYAVSFLVRAPNTERIAIWFVAAVVAHDLVLFPLYALADRSVAVALSWRTSRRGTFAVPAVNHVRLPVLASGVLLLIFFPAILQQGDATYVRASGLHEQTTYLDRWLLITGGLFLVSAASYAARVALAARSAGSTGGKR